MLNDHVKTGMQQAPHRSLFNTLEFTPEEMKKPLVDIISSCNEIVPGHMNLDKIVNAMKLSVAGAGGMSIVMPAIAVCNGIVMGHTGMEYSLVTRDLIADSAKCLARARRFNAMVCVPNCDKNVPGLLVAVAHINTLTIFVSGGPMPADHMKGEERLLSSMFKAVDTYAADRMTVDGVAGFEERVCPTCGSCSGMYTINSLNYLTEVLDMGLHGNSTIPAVYSGRLRLAEHAGNQIMKFYRKDIRPRDIMTEDAFMNTLTIDIALGCSTGMMLHLPAIAYEAKVNIDVSVANEISARTPNLCHFASTGHTYMEDLNEADGAYAIIKGLSKKNLINLGRLTATGKTVDENIGYARDLDPEVIRPVEESYSATGGIAILNGNITPESCVVKWNAVALEMLKHSDSARVSDCEGDAITVIKGGKIVPGDVVVIRYEGPKGGPGIRGMPSPTSAIVDMGLGSTMALITDGRFSGVSRGASIGHVAPETAVGSPIVLTREGDVTNIDINNHTLNARVPEEEFAGRRKDWKPRVSEVDDYLTHYRELVTGAPQGAVLSVEGWHHD